MASSQQKVSPPCPVCQQTDQVMSLPAAYESRVEQRFAPPPMPVAKVGMMKTIVIGFFIVLVGSFIILTFAGVGGYGSWPEAVQVVLVVLVIAGIVTTLVLSFIAFQRIVRGDLQSQQYLPAWDEAMENWRRLYYYNASFAAASGTIPIEYRFVQPRRGHLSQRRNQRHP